MCNGGADLADFDRVKAEVTPTKTKRYRRTIRRHGGIWGGQTCGDRLTLGARAGATDRTGNLVGLVILLF